MPSVRTPSADAAALLHEHIAFGRIREPPRSAFPDGHEIRAVEQWCRWRPGIGRNSDSVAVVAARAWNDANSVASTTIPC